MATWKIQDANTGMPLGTVPGDNANEAIVTFIVRNPAQQRNKHKLTAQKV